VGLEIATGEIGIVVQLTRVGDPFINQDQTRAVVVEQLAQPIAGIRRAFVVRRNPGIGVRAAELPGDLAP